VATSKKKPAAKKAASKKAAKPVKKAPAKKVVAKKAAPKKAAPKKAVTKKAAPSKKASPSKMAAPAKSKEIKVSAATPFTKKPVKKIDLSNFVTPLDDRVMIQMAEAEKMTAGGLYIPDTATGVAGNSEGFVVSIGRGRRDKRGKVHAMDLKVGDKVLFTEHSGSKIKIQEHDLLIVRESDVLGVVG
jgi:chaperonin GroES